MAEHFAGKAAVTIPLVGMLLARAEGIHQFSGDLLGDVQGVFLLVLSFQGRAADRVDRLALLIHYVVVFQQVFAGFEVLRFDGFLGVLDAARNQLGFDGHAFGHAQAVHQGLDALAAEDAQQVVFEREEKARGAGIALAAGAAAKLIVDAARLMAFGAENVQAANGDDFLALAAALLGELIVDRLPLIERNLEDFAFDLEEHHGLRWPSARLRRMPGPPLGKCTALRPRESFDCPRPRRSRRKPRRRAWPACFSGNNRGSWLGIAAEQNVGAAAGHVGGDGDRAFASGLRDDVRFALVLLGVENLMRECRLFSEESRGVSDFSMEIVPTSTGWPLS